MVIILRPNITIVDLTGMRVYLAVELHARAKLDNRSSERSMIAWLFALSSSRSDLCHSIHLHFGIYIFHWGDRNENGKARKKCADIAA